MPGLRLMDDHETYTFGAHPQLIPVVEFEPSSYATQSHPYGEGTPKENPAGWDRHWRDSLADAGIVGLDPVHPGSWIVPVDRLVDAHVLRALLGVHAAKSQDDEDPIAPVEWAESLDAFSGGFVLRDGERDLVFPGCCCCLANLGDWKAAAATENPDWDMLWIGHPWASVRREGNLLQLRLEADGAPPPEPSVMVIDPSSLQRATADAEVVLAAFADRLLPVAEDWLSSIGHPGPGDATKDLARKLAGIGASHC